MSSSDYILDPDSSIITRTINDPHHGSVHQWGWYEGKLYQRKISSSMWTRVKKIRFTSARIRVLNKLVNNEEIFHCNTCGKKYHQVKVCYCK